MYGGSDNAVCMCMCLRCVPTMQCVFFYRCSNQVICMCLQRSPQYSVYVPTVCPYNEVCICLQMSQQRCMYVSTEVPTMQCVRVYSLSQQCMYGSSVCNVVFPLQHVVTRSAYTQPVVQCSVFFTLCAHNGVHPCSVFPQCPALQCAPNAMCPPICSCVVS